MVGYRGLLSYSGVEVANAARVSALSMLTPPTDDTLAFSGNNCPCAANLIRYRDWWSGQESFFGEDYADITEAPWYDAARCESTSFHGVWPMVVDGLGPVKVQRSLRESFCDGGHSSRHRDAGREIRVEALLIACDHPAAVYGLQWLTCTLREAVRTRGADLGFMAASPQDSCVSPASLMRTVPDMVLLQEPRIIDQVGGGFGKPHRHGSIWRVEWVLGSGNPYIYGPAQEFPVVWDDDEPDPIEWVTDCTGGNLCPVHSTVITNPGCPPIRLPDPVLPTTGCTTDIAGCTPLCEGRVRSWQWSPPTSAIGVCGDTVVDITVTNPSETEPLYGVGLSWVPCGGDRDCDRVHDVTISYIPPASSITLDSVRGRARMMQAGVLKQASSLVRGPRGPFSGHVLDGYMCWELVLTTDPATTPEVVVTARPRDV